MLPFFFALFLYSVIVFVTFRLREQAFVEAVGPILTMVIGDDFTDDSLPNKALTMAKDICRKKRSYHQKKQARLANSGKSRKTVFISITSLAPTLDKKHW